MKRSHEAPTLFERVSPPALGSGDVDLTLDEREFRSIGILAPPLLEQEAVGLSYAFDSWRAPYGYHTWKLEARVGQDVRIHSDGQQNVLCSLSYRLLMPASN